VGRLREPMGENPAGSGSRPLRLIMAIPLCQQFPTLFKAPVRMHCKKTIVELCTLDNDCLELFEQPFLFFLENKSSKCI